MLVMLMLLFLMLILMLELELNTENQAFYTDEKQHQSIDTDPAFPDIDAICLYFYIGNGLSGSFSAQVATAAY